VAAKEPGLHDEWWKSTEPSIRGRVAEFWAISSNERQPNEPARPDAWWTEDTGRSRDSDEDNAVETVSVDWSDESEPLPPETMTVQNTQVMVGPITEYSDGATIHNPSVTRIPIRITPGEFPTFTEKDVVLHDGDVVYIESREQDFFYTSGLLGGGQYPIPRDYVLDVLGALSIVQSQVNTQHHSATRNVGGMSVLNQDVSVGASELIIRRKRQDNTYLNVKVDLKKAVRSPQNRIFVQPGDFLILQYTRTEACAAFVQRYLLEPFVIGTSSGAFFGN
jgi:hypothetical protein